VYPQEKAILLQILHPSRAEDATIASRSVTRITAVFCQVDIGVSLSGCARRGFLEKKVEVLRGPSQSAPTEAVKIAILATVLIAVVALVVDVLLALSLSRERALRSANIQSELAPVRAEIGGIKHRVDELEVQGSNKK
jgi:hypothetical protein